MLTMNFILIPQLLHLIQLFWGKFDLVLPVERFRQTNGAYVVISTGYKFGQNRRVL